MTYGKSYAAPMKLFQNWLVTHHNPLPSFEVQMLMWHSWLECYEVMKFKVGVKPNIGWSIVAEEA